jgi:hypothetical protein
MTAGAAGLRDLAGGRSDVLAGRGNLDEAIQILSVRASAGERLAADWLAELLAEHGDLDELAPGPTQETVPRLHPGPARQADDPPRSRSVYRGAAPIAQLGGLKGDAC